MSQVETVEFGGKIMAIILRRDVESESVRFYTPPDFSQQLGLLVHPKGKVIRPHVHRLIAREVTVTQEVLIIQKGKIELDLYDEKGTKTKTCVLSEGDTVLLAHGGHGLRVLEDARIIEVKQGPYVGFDDKEYL